MDFDGSSRTPHSTGSGMPVDNKTQKRRLSRQLRLRNTDNGHEATTSPGLLEMHTERSFQIMPSFGHAKVNGSRSR
jgi:hypothetical protein